MGLIAAIGCGGDGGTAPVPPDPGPLDLVLGTPNADDGALLVTVNGATVTSVQTAGFEVTWVTSGSTTRLLVRGSLVAGPIASVVVPDRHKLGSYHEWWSIRSPHGARATRSGTPQPTAGRCACRSDSQPPHPSGRRVAPYESRPRGRVESASWRHTKYEYTTG